MTKQSRRNPSRTRSIITRSGRSVRNTADGEDSSGASDGSKSYQVEDNRARRGSRASSVESEATDDTNAVYDSTDDSLLQPFQQLRLQGVRVDADISRPAALSPAGVGQEVPVQSGAGAQTQLSMGNQSVAAAISPPDPPAITRPRRPNHGVEAKKARGSFEPRRVSSTPGSSENGDSDDDAELFAADMSPAMQLKYAALRRQLRRARERADVHQVTLALWSLMPRPVSLSWGRTTCSLISV